MSVAAVVFGPSGRPLGENVRHYPLLLVDIRIGPPAVDRLRAQALVAAGRRGVRLSCPDPDGTPPRAPLVEQAGRGVDGVSPAMDFRDLAAVLAEPGGRRAVVEGRARAQLSAEGIPVTGATVARRAVSLLEDSAQGAGSVCPSACGVVAVLLHEAWDRVWGHGGCP